MTETNRFENISNTKLVFVSILLVSALIAIFCFTYSEIVSGEKTTRSLLYAMMAIAACAALMFALFSVQRYIKIVYALIAVMGMESLMSAALTVTDRQHHVTTASKNHDYAQYVVRVEGKFSHHPVLAGMPSANFKLDDLSHTAHSTRTTAIPEDPNAPVVVAIGGSTTYGGTNDQHTWAWKVAERGNLNVVNMGVPGYSSVEHVIQTAFWAPEFNPRCAVYYVGWNDTRSVGVTDIKPDYSNFHMKRQGMQLGVSPHALTFYKPSALENIALFASYLNWRRNKLDRFLSGNFPWWRDTEGVGELANQIDPNAIAYFEQNMKTIIALNQARGVRTILIPQVMNFSRLAGDEPMQWTPFLTASKLGEAIKEYNNALLSLANDDDVLALEHVLDFDWRDEHFVDEGHFSLTGSQHFADLVTEDIAEICR